MMHFFADSDWACLTLDTAGQSAGKEHPVDRACRPEWLAFDDPVDWATSQNWQLIDSLAVAGEGRNCAGCG